MNNLPIPQSRSEELMNAFIQRDSSQISTPQSRIEEFWYHLIEGTNSLPIPQSRNELLLKKIIENDTHQIPLAQSRTEEFLVSILTGDINKLPIPQSRSEYYLDYIARNNLLLNDIDYVRYSGTNITATNTVQKPFRSAILKGSTKYRDIDTGEFLETFEEGRNLELVSVKTPVLMTKNKQTFVDFKEVSRGEGDFVVNSSSDGREVSITTPRWEYISYVFDYEDGRSYTFKADYETVNYIIDFYSVNGGQRRGITGTGTIEFDFIPQLTDGKVIEIVNNIREGSLKLSNIELCPTSNKDEPYKTNILMVNEDVELRGIGDVKDELNLLTGEVVERIGEMVLDGSEDEEWLRNQQNDGEKTVVFYIASLFNHRPKVIMDKFTPCPSNINNFWTPYQNDSENHLNNNNDLAIRISKSKLSSVDVSGFRQWLSQNPITVQYQLATESIKTVDLKVVDQDGNPVNQLSAFDSTTHIISDSESDNSLIAIAEVEVPTKLIEALNAVKSLSSDVEMLINEVDNAQKLQDENSTMVMSAMTELYEMILMMGGND